MIVHNETTWYDSVSVEQTSLQHARMGKWYWLSYLVSLPSRFRGAVFRLGNDQTRGSRRCKVRSTPRIVHDTNFFRLFSMFSQACG